MILALAFLLTVVMEWAVFAWFSKLGFARTGWFCLWLNAATWGAAMGTLTLWPIPILWIELAVILIEAAIIRWFWAWRPGRALLAAALTNLTSWLIGFPIVAYLDRWL